MKRKARKRCGGGRIRQRKTKRSRRKQQIGGLLPLLVPLIAAGITAAGGIGASAVHAAISKE